jgi:hypothetical protein
MGWGRRGLIILSVCWLLFLLIPLSSTGLGFPAYLVTLAVTLLLALIASLSITLTPDPITRVRVAALLAYPLAAVALSALFLTSQSPVNPLFRLRFQLSQAALEAAASAALTSRPLPTPTWVGLFPVRRIDVSPSGEVRFISAGCGIIDECGLLYTTGAIPTGRSKTKAKALGGPWYHLYAIF